MGVCWTTTLDEGTARAGCSTNCLGLEGAGTGRTDFRAVLVFVRTVLVLATAGRRRITRRRPLLVEVLLLLELELMLGLDWSLGAKLANCLGPVDEVTTISLSEAPLEKEDEGRSCWTKLLSGSISFSSEMVGGGRTRPSAEGSNPRVGVAPYSTSLSSPVGSM